MTVDTISTERLRELAEMHDLCASFDTDDRDVAAALRALIAARGEVKRLRVRATKVADVGRSLGISEAAMSLTAIIGSNP